MRRLLLPALTLIVGGALVAAKTARPSYVFVWAGDRDAKSSDFLGVIDGDPSSPHYGQVVASVGTGLVGGDPHHTEGQMPFNDHLLANAFAAGMTYVFDLSKPLRPRIIRSFGDLGGYSHPHTYTRLANGNLLTTFQYKAAPANIGSMSMSHGMTHSMSYRGLNNSTGGLVEMDERGVVIRKGNAADESIAYRRIFPYSALPVQRLDRVVSSTTDMDGTDSLATSEWIQFWKLSDLSLLKTIALKPGPRGNENRYTGEIRLLPDGKSVYIHTFNCGLYLVRDVKSANPTADFVMAFEGTDCGVPLIVGHFWLQPVPQAHALVSMDITDPMKPREVSRVAVGDDETPHWISMNSSNSRVVLNSGGGKGNRLYIINFDKRSGMLAIDSAFRDKSGTRPGISLDGKSWPHGFTGSAVPHGTVFSR